MQAGASQPCAVVPGQRPWCEHDMRAARCEWEVLNRLLSIEQVWTARIDAGHECIEYISLDGTTDRTNSFPMGSKVGDIGLGLGWYCAEVTTVDGKVLDPASNVYEDDSVVVQENSCIIEVDEAQELVASMPMVIGIVDLRSKCQRLAEIETRITVAVRKRIAEAETSQRICFKRVILFYIRVAFLCCSAALHLRCDGDDSDLDQFLRLIREFTSETSKRKMAVMCDTLLEARIFPRMLSKLYDVRSACTPM